jgi:hypothetical protein
VNAFWTSERNRSWSGGSVSSMFLVRGFITSGIGGIWASCSEVMALRQSFTKRSSFSTADTSS